MSSRGARVRNGHVTTTEYEPKNGKTVYDAEVLIGTSPQNHGLPDYAHSPDSKYIKENPDGSFREMRIYDELGFPILEIGYHPEPNLTGNRNEKVLHYHTFEPNLDRNLGGKLSQTDNAAIYWRYQKYLKEYGL